MKIKIFLLIILIFLISGCARMVTVKPAVGAKIQFTIKFAGNVDPNLNLYFAFNKLISPVIPGKQPADPLIFGPGEAIDYGLDTNIDGLGFTASADQKVSYYYDHFFDTWSDYISIKSNSTFKFFMAPVATFPSTANVITHEQFIPQLNPDQMVANINDDTIVISFYLTSLRGAPSLLQSLYFVIFAVDENHILLDTLDDNTNNFIENQLGERKEQTDSASDVVGRPGLNIVSWKVEIL